MFVFFVLNPNHCFVAVIVVEFTVSVCLCLSLRLSVYVSVLVSWWLVPGSSIKRNLNV